MDTALSYPRVRYTTWWCRMDSRGEPISATHNQSTAERWLSDGYRVESKMIEEDL